MLFYGCSFYMKYFQTYFLFCLLLIHAKKKNANIGIRLCIVKCVLCSTKLEKKRRKNIQILSIDYRNENKFTYKFLSISLLYVFYLNFSRVKQYFQLFYE